METSSISVYFRDVKQRVESALAAFSVTVFNVEVSFDTLTPSDPHFSLKVAWTCPQEGLGYEGYYEHRLAAVPLSAALAERAVLWIGAVLERHARLQKVKKELQLSARGEGRWPEFFMDPAYLDGE